MAFKYAHFIPIITLLWFLIGLGATYVISVVNEDVVPIFPYVSSTGVWSIERCIFSFVMSGGAILFVSMVYIRYFQVKEVISNAKDAEFPPRLKKLNTFTVYASLVVLITLIITGSFPEYPYLLIHVPMASTSFFIGWLILVIQTYISFKLYPIFGFRWINIIRVILSVILFFAMNIAGAFGLLSLLIFRNFDMTKWSEYSGGYELHLISTISEWVLVYGVIIFFSLFYKEFKLMTLYKPKVEIINA